MMPAPLSPDPPAAVPAVPVRLLRPLPGLAAWVARLRDAPMPVLASTAEALAELAAHEDEVDAHTLAETINVDPLMTLQLLAHVGTTRRRDTDVETVVGALVLLGIAPFFRRFPALGTVEDTLGDLPEALAGVRAVLRRVHRAAAFALGFAAHRLDPDAAVIHEAALLHDFAELLLWCHAPGLALEVARRQQADPTLRSGAAQQAVLGVQLADLQQALMRAWRLPELLIRLGDDRHAHTPQVLNVRLAVRVARHSAHGWDNPALPDDVGEIGALLQLGPDPTLKLLLEIDRHA
jgi:HD-like signal output (HDOD) protein